MTKCFWTTVRLPYSITKHISSKKNQATIWNYILTAYKYFCLSFCMLTCVTASTRLLDLSRNKVGRPYHLYKIVLTTVPECPTLIASSSLSSRYDCVSKPTTSWNFTHTHTHCTSDHSDEVTPSWWIWGISDKMAAVGLLWFSWISWSTSWVPTDSGSAAVKPQIALKTAKLLPVKVLRGTVWCFE